MNKINEDINLIREFFESEKDSVYPIKNHPIEKADDYLKDLYIKMLCVIKEYDENTCDEQILFINRILKGSNIKQTINEYTKQALTIDESFTQEFILQFEKNKLKYNFFVDALILALINKTISKNVLEFICEVSEMILLNKKEIEFLTEITLSIVEQNNERYHKINKKLDYIDIMWFWCYLKEYVYGCIESSDNKLWYYSKEKRPVEIKNIYKLYEQLKLLQGSQSNKKIMEINEIANIIISNQHLIGKEYDEITEKLFHISNCDNHLKLNIERLEEMVYGNNEFGIIARILNISSNNVIFQNLIIDLTNTKLHFANSEKITFKNCEFIGGKNQIQIDACKSIIIDGCKFKNFTNRVFHIKNAIEITIRKSSFRDCSCTTSNFEDGIVAYIENIEKISISESKFNECQLINSNKRYSSSYNNVIMRFELPGNVKLNIEKTNFINCKVIKSYFYSNGGSYLFHSGKISYKDCEFVGCDPLKR